MRREALAALLLSSRRRLVPPARLPRAKAEAEGGCGVIGLAASVPVAGKHLLQALAQMRNRGNGKGGGIAAVGLDPGSFGVSRETLANDYLLAVALLDESSWDELYRDFIGKTFAVDATFSFTPQGAHRLGLEIPPPLVRGAFVRVLPEVRAAFVAEHSLTGADASAVDDEIVYQTTYRINTSFYASTGEKRAFVLSHGKDLLVLKMVGYGDDVVRVYGLEEFPAHVWIGHHRYPTKGRVWHPGGAHPFIGMHEALVHNGDFANYASIVSYLAQRSIYPLFLTDTEVAVLVFDLLYRVYGYPLEYVIEALAPTTERDFTMLPPEKRQTYRALQTVHMHGSPDGPWFFLIAGSDPQTRACRLLGITDTSMLRPQVFALQVGEQAVGFAASEKQGIDAALESLAAEDDRFWPVADQYWNARGGSHTDGGAFIFTVERNGSGRLRCTDKFGRVIAPHPNQKPPRVVGGWLKGSLAPQPPASTRLPLDLPTGELVSELLQKLAGFSYAQLEGLLARLVQAQSDEDRHRALAVLTALLDRRVPTGTMKRSGVVALTQQALATLVAGIARHPSPGFFWAGWEKPAVEPSHPQQVLVLEARGFPPEGPRSLARALVAHCQRGWQRVIVTGCAGHRFIGCGLGAHGLTPRVDVYGSPGDYLASGIDGACIVVHASAQDQLAQIMKSGKLVVYGDVGQTFGYAAKGGEAFILGNAAGRPMINAVGKPRVVINGTCLDYLAESFMAGDPHQGGGFVILNGVFYDQEGRLREMDTPYPGGNLFSLASGGAIFVRDPHGVLEDQQLNGGAFAPLTAEDWQLILPYLEENQRLFGIAVADLLTVDGRKRPPEQVYRKIVPAGHKALLPEEAWVRPAS
ncbi:GltB/FmdC/FwdC-like GXGXG domain-containing protein [Thermoanaerobaculum aquaticum]|uniref:GltB/FmdC/FwdC-like GXGXG domain-containing protein n=1 Tax=Thermoanaerobaculum aquaticum TaxID=1312852 RepID=UPI000AEE1761|nr:hypothetical protein [Thermoanaerobaculum aquaticum]